MFLMHALLSLTVAAVLAFFVLFAAEKAGGLLRTFGRVLGVWLLVLAVLGAAGAAMAPMMGGRYFGWEMGHMRAGHCYPGGAVAPNGAQPPQPLQRP